MSSYFSQLREGEGASSPSGSKKSDSYTRRFFLDGLREKNLNFMKHFDVVVDGTELLEAPTDYLRVYYTDYLQTPEQQGAIETAKEQISGRVEIHELRKWVSEAKPRTRMDAYPILVLAQNLLSDILNEKLDIFLSELEAKKKELKEAEDKLEHAQKSQSALEKRLATVEEEKAALSATCTKQAQDIEKYKKTGAELQTDLQKSEESKESAVKQISSKLREVEASLAKTSAALEETTMVLRIAREHTDKTAEMRTLNWQKIVGWKDSFGGVIANALKQTAGQEAARAAARASRQWLGEYIMLAIVRHLLSGDGETCLQNDEFKEICTRTIDSVEAVTGCKSVYVALLKSFTAPPDDPPPVGLAFEYTCASAEKKFLEGQKVPKSTPSYALVTEGKTWIEVRETGESGTTGGYVAQALTGLNGDVVGFVGMDTLNAAESADIYGADAVASLLSAGAILSEAYVKWKGLYDDVEEDGAAVHFAKRFVAVFGVGTRGGTLIQHLGKPSSHEESFVLTPHQIKLDQARKMKEDLEKKIFVARKRDIKDMKVYKRPIGVLVQIWQAIFTLTNTAENVILDSPDRSWKAIQALLVEAKTKETPITVQQRLKDLSPIEEPETADERFSAVRNMVESLNEHRVRQGTTTSIMLFIWVRLCLEMRAVSIAAKLAPPPESQES